MNMTNYHADGRSTQSRAIRNPRRLRAAVTVLMKHDAKLVRREES